ncbi:metal-sulfur cluster assembly factor [Corynebacterium freneyi]|uniref:MIP18 family-like domain-containing protein n=1 Tax=Corynebacterium freneyi DNF00450 TaxID=1287475 RepID=A0A095XXM3_9CORY|nr:metal-sulfur cluster assembly factor [Corynebacterium freneyi]KGF14915.1 hypothetical protein HMPREF1650_13270 [Corynebacterium freneyi DNF00450]MDK8766927.1 metal-sulfur cluster assembly factor [Corynebacterium freneyi]
MTEPNTTGTPESPEAPATGDNPAPGLDGSTYEVPPRPDQTPEQEQLAVEVEDRMYDVVDPELGVNVVDLGLVYDIWIEGDSKAVINMTLTSPACPLTDMLYDQAEALVLDHPQVTEMQINWVWSPPWGPHMITEDGREQMRALGFSV